MKFPEFVMTDIRDDDDLTIVSESGSSANRALLQFLIGRGHTICVLKQVECTQDSRGFPHHRDHFIVIGEQKRFSTWLKDALDKQEHREEPTIEYLPFLDEEAVSRWAANDLVKEVWTYFVSHMYDDEFTRGVPTLRSYKVFLRYFAPVSSEGEDSPELTPFRKAGFLAACVKKEERKWGAASL